LVPPGDAALTRRVKAAGDHWTVAEKKGRKVFSKGIWAPAATIERIRADLDGERSTESFAKKKEADARRREKAQAEYVEDFFGAVVKFLAFHPVHADLADRLARAVTDHATPVGSGTVARTQRIPVEERAEAAVIAWMRHQTTGYDGMVIARIRGRRREVRRMLAQRSQDLLERYRRGESIPETCPLMKALGNGFDRTHLPFSSLNDADFGVRGHDSCYVGEAVANEENVKLALQLAVLWSSRRDESAEQADSPEGLPGSVGKLPDEKARPLQGIAWKAVQATGKR